jgi:hypothetical protein
VDHTDGYVLIDSSGRERFVDASAPDIPDLSPKLRSLLDEGGVLDLTHPLPTSWTTADLLTALSWVLGTTVPAAGS